MWIINSLESYSCAYFAGLRLDIARVRDAMDSVIDGWHYSVSVWDMASHKRRPLFVDHLRYFLAMQLGDWRN
ncbi:MAG: hypothetical protein V7K25_29760 [Nostoc sp.]|uniref:hypothetical protein n=1 Tax=Nostoc sp. TaxID=1180 RepID=UPI002FF5426C